MVGEYSSFETTVYDKFTASTLHDWSQEILFPDIEEHTPSGGRVLDVGCGGGQFALKLKDQRPDLDVTGLDVTQEMIELARERASKRGIEATFDCGNALNLPYESNNFDYVLSLGSIKHWPNQQTGLSECVRVLKPGGTLQVIELQKGLHLAEYYSFLCDLDHPPVLREFFYPFFLCVVHQQGVDETTYERLANELSSDLENQSIYEADKTEHYDVPLLVLKGTKARH